MISQANIKWISTLSGVTEEEISGALSKEEEVTLDLKLNGRVISQTDEAALKTTLTDAGIEIGYKKLAKEAGLNLDSGEKDAKIIADKLKASITTVLEEKYKGQTPSDELKAVEIKLESSQKAYDKLKGTYEETLGKVTEKEQAFLGLQKDIKAKELNNTVLKSLPEKMKIDKDSALIVAINTFQFEDVEGKTVAKRDGQIITNGLGEPETIDNVVKSFVEEKKWVKGSGMGGDDRPGGGNGLPKGMTNDAALAYMTEKGVDSMSTKGTEMFTQLTSKE